MSETEGISLEQLQVLTDRAGLSLTPDEVAALKPMYDLYAKQIQGLFDVELEAEDLAVAFSPNWDPQS